MLTFTSVTEREERDPEALSFGILSLSRDSLPALWMLILTEQDGLCAHHNDGDEEGESATTILQFDAQPILSPHAFIPQSPALDLRITEFLLELIEYQYSALKKSSEELQRAGISARDDVIEMMWRYRDEERELLEALGGALCVRKETLMSQDESDS
jgi:hypothetical protein